MTVQQIRYFLTAARYQNFSKAAKELFITQSALSRQIAAMERELGYALFDRAGKRVRLSPAGEVGYGLFPAVYGAFEEALEQMGAIREGASEILRIGVLEGVDVGTFLPGILERLALTHPQIAPDIRAYSYSALEQRVMDGSLDLIISHFFAVSRNSELEFSHVRDGANRIAMLRTHTLAQYEMLTLEDIKDEPLIVVSGAGYEAYIQTVCQARGFTPKLRLSPGPQTSMLWVLSGMGPALLDSNCSLARDDRVKFLSVHHICDTALVAAWNRESVKPAVRAFIGAVVVETDLY